MKHRLKQKMYRFLCLVLVIMNILSCANAAELIGNQVQQVKGHKHTFACYDEYQTICNNDSHIHKESCYEGIGDLVCGIQEGDMEHVHNAWQDEGHKWVCEEIKVLICDKEEHQHGPDCFAEAEGGPKVEEVIDPDASPDGDKLDTSFPEEPSEEADGSITPITPSESGEDGEESGESEGESSDSSEEKEQPDYPISPKPPEVKDEPVETPDEGSNVTETPTDEGEKLGGDSDQDQNESIESPTEAVKNQDEPAESPAETENETKNADETSDNSEPADTVIIESPDTPFASEQVCEKEEHTHDENCFTVIYKCRLEAAAMVNSGGIIINGTWKTSTASGSDNTITVENDGRDAHWSFSNSTYFNYGIDFSLSIEPGITYDKDQVHIFLPQDVIPLRDGKAAAFGNIESMLQNNDVWSLKGTKELAAEDFAVEYSDVEIAALSDEDVNYIPEDELEFPSWDEIEQERAEALSTLEPDELDGYTEGTEPKNCEVALEQIAVPFAAPDEKVSYYEIINDKKSVSGEQKFSFSGYIKDELYKIVDGTEFEYPIYVVVTGDAPSSAEIMFKGSIDTNLHESYLRETSYQSNYIRDHGLQRIYSYNDKLRTRYGVGKSDFESASQDYAYLEYVFDAHISGNKTVKYNMRFTPNKNGEILGFCNIDDSRLITQFLNPVGSVEVEDGNVYTLSKDATLYTTANDGKSHTFGVLVRYKKAGIEDTAQPGHISVNCKVELEVSDLDGVDDLSAFNDQCTLTNSSNYAAVGYSGNMYSGLLKPEKDDRLGAGALSDLAAGLDSAELPVIAESTYRAYMNNERVNNDFVADPNRQYKMDMFVDKMFLMDDAYAHDCDNSYYFTKMEDLKISDGYQEMDESGLAISNNSVELPAQLFNTKVEIWVCTSDAPDTWVKDGDVLLSDCWQKNYHYGNFSHKNVIRVKIHYPSAYGFAKITSELWYRLRGDTLKDIAERVLLESKRSVSLITWGGVIAYNKEGVPFKPGGSFIQGSSADEIKSSDHIFWKPFFESFGYADQSSPYRMPGSRSITALNRSADMSLGMKAWNLDGKEVKDLGDLNISVLDRMAIATKATVNLGYTSESQVNEAVSHADPSTDNIANIKKAVFFTLLPEGLEFYQVKGGTDGKYLNSVGISNQAAEDNGVTYLWHRDNYAGTNRTMVCYSVDQPDIGSIRRVNNANDYGLIFGATITARPITADIYPGTHSVNVAGFFVLENGKVFDFTDITEDTIYRDDGSVFPQSGAFVGLEEAYTAREPGNASEKMSVVGRKCELSVSGRPVSTELRVLSKGPKASQGYAPVTMIAPTDDYSYRMSFIIGGADQVSNLGIVANLECYDKLLNANVTKLEELPTKMTGIDVSELPDDLQDALEVYVNTNYVDINEYNQNPTEYSGKKVSSVDGWTLIDYKNYSNWDSVKAIYFYFPNKTISVPTNQSVDYLMLHIILKMQAPEDGWYKKDVNYNAFCQAIYIDNLFGVDADTRFTSSGSNIAEIQIGTNGAVNANLKTNHEFLNGEYSGYSNSATLLGSGQKFNYAYDLNSEGSVSDLSIISNYLPDRWAFDDYDLSFWLDSINHTELDRIYVWTKSDKDEYDTMYAQAQSLVHKDDIKPLLDLGWVEYNETIDKSSIRGLLFHFGNRKFSSNDKVDFTVSNIGSDEVHTNSHDKTSYAIKFQAVFRIYGTSDFDSKESEVSLATIDYDNSIRILSSREDAKVKNTPMDLKNFDEIKGNTAENLSHIVSYGVSKTDSYQEELIINDYDAFDTVVDIPTVYYGKNLKAIVSIDNSAAVITGIDVIGAKHLNTDQLYVLHRSLDSETESLADAGFVAFDNYDNVQAVAFDLGPDNFLLNDTLPNGIQARYVIHWKSSSVQGSSTVKAQLYYDSIGCLERKNTNSTNTINFNAQINPSIGITLNYPDEALTRDTTLLHPSDFSYTIKFGLDQKSVPTTDIVLWTPMSLFAPANEKFISRFFAIDSIDTTYWTDGGTPVTVFGSKSEDITEISDFFAEGSTEGNHKFVEYLKENWDILNDNSDLSEYKQLAFWLGDSSKENADGYNQNGSYYLDAAEINHPERGDRECGIIVNTSFNLDDKAFIDFYKDNTINSLNNEAYYVLNTNHSTVSAGARDYGRASSAKLVVNKTVAHRELVSDEIQNTFSSALDWLTALKLSYSEHYAYKLELNAVGSVNAADIILLDTIEYKSIWESLDEKFKDSGDSSQFHCQLEGVDMSEFDADNIPYTIYVKTVAEPKGTLLHDAGLYYENTGITPEDLQKDWIPAENNTDWSQVKQIAIWLGTPEGGSWVDPMTDSGSILSDQPHSAYLLMKAEFEKKPPVGKSVKASNGAGLHYSWGGQSITVRDFGKYTDVTYTNYNTDPVVSKRNLEVRSGPDAEPATTLGTKPGWDYEYRLNYKVEKGATNVVFVDTIEHVMGEEKSNASGLVLESFTLSPSTYKIGVGDPNPVMTIKVKNASEFPVNQIELQFSDPDFLSLLSSLGFSTGQDINLEPGQSQIITQEFSNLDTPQTISTTLKVVSEEYHLESNTSESVTLTVSPQFRTITYKNTTDGDTTTLVVRDDEEKSEEQITGEFLGKVNGEYLEWHDFEGWVDAEDEPDTKIAEWTSYEASVTYLNDSGVPVSEKIETLPTRASQDNRVKNAIEIKTYPKIKEIEHAQFSGCEKLASFILHDGISSIGDSAFSNCKNLTTIELSKNLTTIGCWAFQGCKGLKSITIPEKITCISRGTFEGCSNLTEINLPENLVELEYNSFLNCSSLKTINLPEKLKTIGSNSFTLTSIENIVIPQSVTSIGESAFSNTQIENIEIPQSVTSIGVGAFSNCSKLKSISIPDHVSKINNSMFSNCTGLSSVKLPEHLLEIGSGVFSGCTSLESIEIPDSVQIIGKNETSYIKFKPEGDPEVWKYGSGTFEGCNSLKSIILPANLNLIGMATFKDCTSLSEIIIPDNVNKIGFGAFYNCNNLSSIELPNSIQSIEDGAFRLCEKLSEIAISDGIKSIGSYAFSRCNLKSMEFPDSVRDFGDYIFNNNKQLTTVKFPNEVSTFGIGTFMGCGALVSANIPQNATSLFNTFIYCGNLERVELPNTIQTIGSNAFLGCSKLTRIDYPNGLPNITEISDRAFWGCRQLSSFIMPVSVTKINHAVFKGCNNLTINYRGNKSQFDKIEKKDGIADATNFTQYSWNPDNRPVHYMEQITYMNQTDNDHTTIYIDNPEKPIEKITEDFLNNVSDEYKEWHEFQGWADDPNDSNIKIAQWKTYKCKIEYKNANGDIVSEKFTSLGTGVRYEAIKIEISPFVNELPNYAFNGCTTLTSVVLPDNLTSIGEEAFNYCTSLTSINFPKALTSISAHAFKDCSSLTSIIIPDHITEIGQGAFLNCTALESISLPQNINAIEAEVFSNCTSLATIDIPSRVTRIGEMAFMDCQRLTSIVIPNNVYDIENSAFEGCSALETIKLSENIKKISDNAFAGCTYLSSISIPQNVESIGLKSFSGCTSLTSIDIPNHIASIDGGAFANCISLTSIKLPDNIQSINSDLFRGCRSLVSVNIPENVTTIGRSAFDSCEALTTIDIPANVTKIWDSAFSNCKSLESIILPDKLSCIGSVAFQNCTSLKNISIPDGVKEIEYYAFSNCSNLATITIPNSVTHIYQGAFSKCTSLLSVTIPGSVKTIESNTFSDCTSLTEAIISNGVTSIMPEAFARCPNLSAITIPGSINSIGSVTFSGCTSLENITIEEGVKSIQPSAFAGCSKLTTLTIPGSVKTIEPGLFSGCTSLVNVTFGDGVTSIPSGTFSGCSNLTTVNIPGSVNSIASGLFQNKKSLVNVTIGDGVKLIDSGAFYDCTNLTTIDIPDSVEIIQSGAFSNCTSLTNVIIGSGVKSINSGAFQGCSKLVDVTIPGSVTTINSGVFSGCTSLASITMENGVTSISQGAFSGLSSLTSVTIPGSVTSIGSGAFSECTSLASITIPSKVKSIENDTFKNCSSLVTISIPNGVESIGIRAFIGCSSLGSVNIPNSITSIGDHAFRECSSLATVVLPDKLTAINYCAFYNCESLTSIAMPDTVESIGEYAFRGCAMLEHIDIPNSVTSIGQYAFAACPSLKSFDIPIGLLSISKGTFHNCSALVSVKIPDGMKTIGESAFYNCTSLDSISIPQTVTQIGEFAFQKCSSLHSVIIPDSIENLTDASFRECTLLKSVTLSDNIKSIGNSTFYKCSSLTSVTIPNKVISIGPWAFGECSSLVSITLSNNLKSIGSRTFYKCSNLNFIVIPDGVTDIGSYAFSSCYKLSSIFIPNSITNINNNSFAACTTLKIIVIPTSITNIGQEAFYNCHNVIIHYLGTQSQFDSITKGDNWNHKNRPIIYCGDGSCPDHSAVTTLSAPVSPFAELPENTQINEDIIITEEQTPDSNDQLNSGEEITLATETDEPAPILTEQSGWKGTLTAIDTSEIESKGLTAITFVSTEEIEDWWPVLQPWNDAINANKEPKSLEWYQRNVPLGFMLATPETDMSVMRSIMVQVVDLRDYGGVQNEYYMTEGDELSVTLKMHVPENITTTYPDIWSNPYAYNQFFTLENTVNPGFEGEEPGEAGVIKTRLAKSNQVSVSMFVNVHLPETGGSGVTSYILIGSTLILAAWLILKRKKEEV